MNTRAWRLASILAAVTVIAGCATSVAGTPGVDPAAVTALATAGSTTTSPSTPLSSNSGTLTSTPPTTASGSGSPIRPVPPSTTARTSSTTASAAPTPTTSSRPPRTTSSATTIGTVQGLPIDDIVAELAKDPVVADQEVRDAADASALTSLDDQVTAARTAGLNIWVVLVGHDVDSATDVSDAVAKALGGTAVVVTKTKFAVTSKEFSKQQLQDAEDAATKATDALQAASILVEQFGQMTKTGGTTPAKTSSTGTDVGLDRFQLADHSIGCAIMDDAVRCDLIVDHTYTPPKNPHPDCQGDYGSSIQMPADGASSFICISDTVYDPSLPVLPDGGSSTVGNVMCFANGPAVTCLSLKSAHGFMLSPSKFTLA